MKSQILNRLRSFRRDRTGTTSILFAGGILTAIIVTAAAIDYSTAVNTRARLQAGVDSAILAAAKQGALTPSTYLNNVSALQAAAQAYLTADGPVNATISDFHACLESGGDCTTAGGRTLQVGQFYIKGTTTYTPFFNNVSWLPGSNSADVGQYRDSRGRLAMAAATDGESRRRQGLVLQGCDALRPAIRQRLRGEHLYVDGGLDLPADKPQYGERIRK